MAVPAEKLERLYEETIAVDEALAKALGVTEIARSARIEVVLRNFLLSAWNQHQEKAIAKAVELAQKLRPASEIAGAVDKEMSKWAPAVTPRFLSEFERVYILAREAAWKKAIGRTRASLARTTTKMPLPEVRKQESPIGGEEVFRIRAPQFNVVDRRAVAALQKHQRFWIGQHYDNNVSGTIARTARETMVEAGRRPAVAGRLMRERVKRNLSYVDVPKGFHGTQAQYFEGLTANAATVAHAHGQMRSFIDFGVSRYQITNPSDDRTCEVCQHMNGKIFSVSHGTKVMEAELAAETPDQVKSAHPFRGHLKQVKEFSPKGGPQGPGDAKKCAEAGFSLPPFHFRCRCTVDISEEAGSFIPPTEKPIVPLPPKVKAPKPKAPPKMRPAEFPKQRQHRTRPDDYFRPESMLAALEKTKKGAIQLTAKAQVEVRKELNAICAEYGMRNTDVLHKGKGAAQFTIRKSIAGAYGQHHTTSKILSRFNPEAGKVEITNEVAASAKNFLRKIIKGKSPVWGEVRKFHTCLHEVVHGHSRMGPGVYARWGKALEEGTTTMATEKMMVEKFGLSWGEARAGYVEFTGAISEAVDATLMEQFGKTDVFVAWSEKFATKAGGNWAGYQLSADAAIRMRSMKTISRATDEYLVAYLKAFELPAELTAGMKKAQITRLTRKFRSALSKKLEAALEKSAKSFYGRKY